MQTLDAIKKRRTIRKFKDKPISNENLRKILEAGNLAPCAAGLANWRFVVITANEDKKEIAKAAFNQEFIEDAAILIVVCSDSERLKELYGERGEMYAIQNTAAAIENMLLAATDLGIGSAWIGAFDKDEIAKVIHTPYDIDIHSIVALGYPNEIPKVVKLKLPDVVYFDRWGKSEIGRNKKRG